MQVNGLYGWVRSNDARSVALFAGFVLAFHLLMALGLFVPLAMFDPKHAPLYHWGGYAIRWLPLVTAAGAALFLVQMAWHVRAVRRATGFHFVDSREEPRLCGIVEPLTIAAGLPAPYVAIIESPALNAFACGVRRRDAVLVFTRGLVDGLDDEELAAVAAHEISHIVNGDIRLIAAANVCLTSLLRLTKQDERRSARMTRAATLPLVTALFPLFLVIFLAMTWLRQLGLDAGRLTRMLIASSREFIADAEAVRLTQNPAALVSALRRIDGRSRVAELSGGEDAMMIDGAKSGPWATHPPIAERVQAIVAVTGSMALNAPARRRDTRAAYANAGSAFGRRPPTLEPIAPEPDARGALDRVRAGQKTNRFGLRPEMTVALVAALVVLPLTHRAAFRSPVEAARLFDPRPLKGLVEAAGMAGKCEVTAVASLAGRKLPAELCKDAVTQTAFATGALGAVAARQEGLKIGGTFSSMAPRPTPRPAQDATAGAR